MKRQVEPKTDAVMLAEFPRRARAPDWFIRIRELSPGHMEVVARDRWGREVSRSGGEPELDRLLEECECYAEDVSKTT